MKRPGETSVTRRDIAAAVAAFPLLARPGANAQTAPADEVAAVRQQRQRTTEELRRFKVPIATEPSFAFRP